ncbi:hypothetical protein FHR32_003641 [Streptosporangium album]|uniref:Uncharacterized protein n=1 Tax=Streptosporangium album TaxID=47479 RepID=A0A7W7RW63_9ACTN|nr:hypothetical protein [Streptosporangium album]MBB4939336.1 hypothetical protein [Streptosporangium album]
MSIASTFQGGTEFTAYAPGNGATLIRDLRQPVPRWNDLSSLANYPGKAVGVTVAPMGNSLRFTVLSSTGAIAATSCTVQPQPGTGGNPAWPKNCTGFVNHTPPY